MADRRVAADEHNIARERAFTQQLAAAIFCENNFHLAVTQVVDLRVNGIES